MAAKQRGVDHRGAQSLEDGGEQPGAVRRHQYGEPDATRLDHHAPRDEPFPADAIRQHAGRDLQQPPHDRVDGLDDSDPLDVEPVGAEEQRVEAPGHPVVEVVDQPGLAGGEEAHVAKRGHVEDAAERRRMRRRRPGRGLELHVVARLPDQEDRHQESDDRDADPQIERLRTQRVVTGDVPGHPGHRSHREVARELVEAEGQTPAARAHEVDLHDHGHRPRHAPGWRPGARWRGRSTTTRARR